MKIWHSDVTLKSLSLLYKNTMIEHLGIELIEVGDNFITARMSVDHRTLQPAGIMHGGASCVLAETVASVAGNCCLDPTQYYCVGLDINTNHIRSIRSGFVIATAKPFHLGKSTQVWGVEIMNEDKKLISITRLTIAVLKKSLSL